MDSNLHRCGAPGCPKQIKKSMAFCYPHWGKLPPRLQVELTDSFYNILRDRERWATALTNCINFLRTAANESTK